MPASIEIKWPKSSDLHRVRNFAEELSLSLGELGTLPMSEADAATDLVTVANIKSRKVGRCQQLIERVLAKHLMTNDWPNLDLRVAYFGQYRKAGSIGLFSECGGLV